MSSIDNIDVNLFSINIRKWLGVETLPLGYF